MPNFEAVDGCVEAVVAGCRLFTDSVRMGLQSAAKAYKKCDNSAAVNFITNGKIHLLFFMTRLTFFM
jgi:hypothetical protein